jgi:capsular polysaccharide biosynthesis protein
VEVMLILRVLLRRWYLVVIPVMIVAVVVIPDFLGDGPAIVGGYTTMIHYTAAQELDAIPDREGDYQDVWLASELTVNAFTGWVRTSSFAREVTAALAARGLEVDTGVVRGAINSDSQRSIGQIFINWPDHDQLVVLADAVIEVLTTRNQEYFPQLGASPAHVRLLDEVRIAPAPPPLLDRYTPLVRLGLALLIGVGLAFAVEYFDPTLRGKDELEALGVRVLGAIPRK